MPDHCVQSTSVKEQNFDYEVPFNREMTPGNWENNLSTQHKLNNALCPIVKRYDALALGVIENGWGRRIGQRPGHCH